MRIDGPHPHPWQVYHATWCRVLKYMLWVDTDTLQWCQAVFPYRLEGGEIASKIFMARRIDVFPELQLIVIDPLPDPDGSMQGHEKREVTA